MKHRAALSLTSSRARGFARPKAVLATFLLLALVLCLALGATTAFAAGPGTLVDAGFESRTDGTALDASIWTLFGAPAKAEYDTLRAKNGSLSAWIQGSAATAYTGVIESETGAMSSDGAEIRFWTYFDNTTTGRLVDDIDPSINNAARAFLVNFQNNGALSVYTSKAGNPNGYTTGAYTPVGTYTTGWTQYRLVMDFSTQTYTLSSRVNASDAWTPIKAPGATGYAIPMLSASPVTATHGTRWRSYYAAQWWVDDIAYSPTGISDPDTTAPAVPTGLSATPGTAQVALSWNANTEPDLSGYNVYRDGVLLTPVPIPAAAYTDSLLIDGTYAYTVSAVDATGNESARSGVVVATVGTVTPPTGPALVDAGFESRTDGTALDPSIWTLFGAPAKAEYDTLRARSGSLSAWIQGTAAAAYTGVIESETGAMSSDGAEIRFWTYFDNTTTGRLVDDIDPSINNAARAFLVNFQNNGALSVYTSKAGNPNGYTTGAYTPVGTYTTGWTQYRLVMDFTNQTYTLSSRANAADAWTPIKAPGATGYGIPMLSASTVSATHGTRFRSYYAAQWWVDDLTYSATGISDGGTGPDTNAPSAPAALSAVDRPADSGGSIDLSWLAASDNVAVTGYRLYRGTASGVYGTPTTLGDVTGFTDATAVTGTRYYYAVSALDAAGNEGPKSPEASAVSADNLAPAVPSGLSATPGTAQVALSWNANTEPDLSGYDVLRDGVKVNTTRLTATSYTDTGLADGTYSYRIVATDTHGNSSTGPAASATVGTVTPPTGPALVDAGFESRSDATALDSGIWTLFGAPARAEYDTARFKNGALSAWIQGTAATAYTGVIETKTGAMSSDGAEIRFWTYFDNTTTGRIVDDVDPSINNAARAFLVNFQNNGALSVYTSKAGNPGGYTTNAYTPVGTYTTGWTQYRLVMDFTNQTYTLSSRVSATDAWTQIKAPGATGYGIPMLSASTVTATHGTRWRAYYAASMWVDDLTYSATGITDVLGPYTITSSAGTGGSIAPAGATTVAHGASQAYTITPASGYTIADVLVDGASVGAVTSYTFSNVSANHTIAASFVAVSAGGDMPVSYIDCDSCHARGSALDDHDHPCASCHDVAWGHPGTPSDYHTPAVVTTCTPCHDPSITVEHNKGDRTTAGGAPIVCDTCHGSTDPLVKSAIAAGNSACSACHGTAGHAELHANTTTTCAGVGCHNGLDLTSVHTPIGCACHDSEAPKVVSAIASGNRDCDACHNPMAIHGAVHNASLTYEGAVGYRTSYAESTYSKYAALACTSCHRVNLLANHGSDYTSCPTCHANGAPRSSFTSWDKTCQTGACHPVTATINSLPVAPHPAPSRRLMNHPTGGVVAEGYQAPPYCNQCHNTPKPACGAQYGCHAGAVSPATSVDFTAPTTSASMIGTTPVTWSLDAVDRGDGVSATYYAFDNGLFALYGTAEKTDGITNPADITSPGTHQLRFYSVDEAGNVEAVVTHSYTTGDYAPPVVSFNGIVQPGVIYTKSLDMTVADPKDNGFGTGVASIHTEVMTYNRVYGYPYPTPFYQPMADFTYPRDASAGSTRTVLGVEAYAKAKSSATFPTYSAWGANSGKFLFQYTTTDFAGNQTAPVAYTVIIDNDAPVTTPATVTAGEYRWKLNASDSTTPTTYYSFDDAPFEAYTASDASNGIVNTLPAGSSQGAHNLRYYSVDALGQVEATKTHTYSIVETTAPMASLSATMTSTSVTISAWDPEGPLQRSGVKSIVGNVSKSGVTKSISTTFAAGDPAAVRSVEVTVPSDGTWSLTYYVYDWDGNSRWYNQAFYRDTTPPSSSVGGGWSTEWQLSAADGFGVGVAAMYYSFDGGPYTEAVIPPGSWAATFTTPAQSRTSYGTHTLSYYSVDKFGFSETPRTASWLINDITKPTIALVKSGGTWSQSAYLSAQDPNTAPSGVKEISYRINDGAWATSSFDTSGNPTATVQTGALILPNGIVKVDYYVVDVAGNSSVSKTDYIQIDNAPPVVSVTHESTNADGSAVVRVAVTESGVGSGVDRCWYEYTDGTGAHATGVITGAGSRLITLPPPAVGTADAQVSAYARDWIGNQGEPVVLSIAVTQPADVIPPVTTSGAEHTPIVPSADGNWVWEISATDSGSGVDKTYYKIDAGEWQMATYVPVMTVEGTGFGPHTLSYYSVDNAGNVEDAKVVSFEITEMVTLSFDMTNTLDGSNWKAIDYAYDVLLYDASGEEIDGWNGQTQYDGVPASTIYQIPDGYGTQPYCLVLTIYSVNSGDQVFTWENVTGGPGDVIELSGTYEDALP